MVSINAFHPTISVIMPAHNAETYIGAALNSLRVQTRTDFEVIVVDDESSDCTVDIVQDFVRGLPKNGPKVRLICQGKSGVSAARNRGASEARSELIGFLDADDYWEPEKVALHVALMEEHPEIDISFSGFRYVDGNGKNLYQRYMPLEGILPFEKLMERNVIHTSTVIARFAAFQEIGGFDTTLRMYEDYDLWLRIGAIRRNNIYGMSRCLADYRRHAGQTTQDWRAMHDGWCRVTKRLSEEHPREWARVRRIAWSNQLEYCAALTYNAGDTPNMRRLMWRAWRKGGLALMLRKDALVMTGVAMGSFLPRPLQLVVGRSFLTARKTKRFVEDRKLAHR